MERRNVIKLMIASAIAPAFVAQGLMKVKPIILPSEFTVAMVNNFREKLTRLAAEEMAQQAFYYSFVAPYSTNYFDYEKYRKAHYIVRSINS